MKCDKQDLERMHASNKSAEDLAQIEARAKAEGIDARWPDPKKARVSDWKRIESGDWDGFRIVTDAHPLDAELNPHCSILTHYTVAYRAASAMVHCSIRALDNTFAVSSFPFKVGEGMKTEYDHRFEPLMTILAGLHLSVRYTLYGAKLECPAKIDKLLEETVRKLRYERQA